MLWTALLLAPAFSDELHPDVLAAAEAALVEGATDSNALHDMAILEMGTAEPLLLWLEDQGDSGNEGAALLAAHLAWKSGDLAGARVTLKPLVEAGASVEVQVLYARLLDALDWTDEAIEAYQGVLDSSPDPELERWLQLRLALMSMEKGDEHAGALAEFASEEGTPRDFRNRSAIVLALLDRPSEAIDLYMPTEEEGTPLFRDLVRMAEWAVRAEDAVRAQDYSWRAAMAATLTRDRAYALAVLVEAHRLDESLDALVERFSSAGELPEAHRARWIELLRDLDRTGEAIELFTAGRGGNFDRMERRQLLEMFRDAGQEERMVAEYAGLFESEPREVLWREGLARFYLENGDRENAEAIWRPFVEAPIDADSLAGAEALSGLGLDELAIECAERVITGGEHAYPGLLFLYSMHSDRGRLEEAAMALERLDEIAPPDHGVRMDLAECFERLGDQARALEIYEGVQAARPDETQGEDMAMRLAWLYSEVDREEEAMSAWLTLWERVNSVPRRRYVEDRLMTVASRLGKLADVAIELERKLFAGTANERESGLLVRLYTKVGDSVSATEVIEEFMKQTGGAVKDILEEKARVYIACTDYARYEETVRELMKVDPDGEGEYLRQLAMSMLERGKPDEARDVLTRLKELETDSAGDEFEAGVLALAGMREEALVAYRRGIVRHPDRIDSLLLLAGVMKDTGNSAEAIGIFQHLMEVADRDDLFTIAVDGLLNLEAPPDTLRWARRVLLERLAGREGKMYLFQLYSDLSEELNDREGQLVALENALPIAGSRRPSLLRELMDLASIEADDDGAAQLGYGRRLIGLAEIVPPQVYLDLGESFLLAGEIENAAKTFGLASDQPDYARLQRQAAGLFDEQGYPREALTEYERALVSQATDVGLMAKVAELCEQLGYDERALELYARGMELIHQRRTLRTGKAEEEDDTPVWWRARNLDDYDEHHNRLRTGILATSSTEAGARLIAEESAALRADLQELRTGLGEGTRLEKLSEHPRLEKRAFHHRRLAMAFGALAEADEVDLLLLDSFPEDEGLLERLVKGRVEWGQLGSARRLIAGSGRSDDGKRSSLFLVGEGTADDASGMLPLDEATRLLLPRLAVGDREGAEALLRRTDLSKVDREQMPGMQVLFSAAQVMEADSMLLNLGRQWVRLLVKQGTHQYELEPVLERVGAALADEERLAFYQYFVSLILEEPEKAAGLITMLPKVQSVFEEPLLSSEQVADLLDGYGEGGYGWGLGPVLALLPEEERAGALRGVWTKIKPSAKTGFLIDLVTETQGSIGPELSEFIKGAFPATLEDADDFFVYSVGQLWDHEHDLDVVAVMHEALLISKPRDWNVRGLGWVLSFRNGEIDAAVKEAAGIYIESLDAAENDYQARSIQYQVHELLLPDHLGPLLEAFDGDGQKLSVERTKQRLELIEAADDDERALEAYLAATEEHPEEVDLWVELKDYYSRHGQPRESLRILEHIATLEPEKRKWQGQIESMWLRLSNPIEALAARLRKEALPEDDESGGSNIPGLPPGFILPAGSRIIINGVVYTGGVSSQKDDPRRQKEPTIQLVHEFATEKEDPGSAQRTLRRLWRSFKKGEQSDPWRSFYGWGYGRLAQLTWPEDPEEEDQAEEEEEDEPYRGGLLSYSDEEPEPRPERTNGWQPVGGYDWGAAEMRRFARTFEARQVDGYQPLFEGLLAARLENESPEDVFDELLGMVVDETGGKVEQVMLLGLLDMHPELTDERVGAVLERLVGAANPVDGRQVLRLARMYTREGQTEEAIRLYRWCATQTASVMRFSFGGPVAISAFDLVKEAKESLDGEARDEVVEAVLRYADPGRSPWQRESFETLVLTTWDELYGAEEALKRGREICEASIDPTTGLRRGVAAEAAALFARGGELDSAMKALEFAICKLDPDLFHYDEPWYRLNPQNYGYLSTARSRKLMPREWEGEWASAPEWFEGMGTQLLTWVREDRVRTSSCVQPVAIAVRRLVSLEETGRATRLAEQFVATAGEVDFSDSELLWVLDAAREAGLEDAACALELDLFERDVMQANRLGEVLTRIAEREGSARARELGERSAEWVLEEDLLLALVTISEADGDAEAATRWRTRHEAAEAARAEIERLDEEAKAEAEAKSE